MSVRDVKVVDDKNGIDEGGLEGGCLKRSPSSTQDSGILEDADENDNKTTNTKRIRSSPGEEASSRSPVQKLEVPSEELKCIQKQVLIEKLMSSGETAVDGHEKMETQESNETLKVIKKPKPPSKVKGPPQPRKTFRMHSSVLDRVKGFLPEFKCANESLLRLPDPSKISLESDSDRDEIDANRPGPSSGSGSRQPPISDDSKTFVEMNLALVEQSDSDTSSEDESTSLEGIKIKGLPVVSSASAPVGESKTEEQESTQDAKKDEDVNGKKPLITELN